MNSFSGLQSFVTSAPQSISRMDEALSEVSGRVDELAATIDTLRVRIGGALVPEPVTGDQAVGSEQKRPQSAALVENVSSIADRVRRSNQHLLDLLNRLAL